MQFDFNNKPLDGSLTWSPYDASTDIIYQGGSFDIRSDVDSKVITLPISKVTDSDIFTLIFNIIQQDGTSVIFKDQMNDTTIYLNGMYYNNLSLTDDSLIFNYDSETIKSFIEQGYITIDGRINLALGI